MKNLKKYKMTGYSLFFSIILSVFLLLRISVAETSELKFHNVNDYEKQLSSIYKKNQLNSASPAALLKLGDLSLLKTDYADAFDYYKKITDFYPNSKEYKKAFFNKSLVLYLQGKYKESKKSFELFLKQTDDISFLSQVYIKLADIYYQEGNIAEAINYYEKILAAYRNNPYKSWVFFQLGNCYDYAKQYPDAYIAYRTITDFYPESLEYYQAKQKIDEYTKKNMTFNLKSLSKNNSTIFYIQTAAFSVKDKAENFKKELEKKFALKNVFVYFENNYYKVLVGDFGSLSIAENFMSENNIKGFVRVK